MNIFEFSPNISNFYQIFQHFHQIFGRSMEYFEVFGWDFRISIWPCSFFCWYMTDSCTTMRTTNQHRAPSSIFFSSPCCSIQVSMQTTGFLIRLLKRIDILVAICREEKKIRIYRRIMFHRTTLFRLSRLFGFKSARRCCHFYPCVRFYKHLARFGTTVAHRCATIIQHSQGMPCSRYVRRLLGR